MLFTCILLALIFLAADALFVITFPVVLRIKVAKASNTYQDRSTPRREGLTRRAA
jgi:hypothetical protein